MFLVILALLQIGGILINALVGWYFQLTIGIMTFEDFYLYSYQFNKAHMKIGTISMGLSMGYLYLRILEYRKATPHEKLEKYKIIHFIHKSLLVQIFLYAYGILVFLFITLVPRSANDDAYSWSRLQNTVYTALSIPAYLTSVS